MNHLTLKFINKGTRSLYANEVFSSDSENHGVDIHTQETVVVPAKALGFKIGLGIQACMRGHHRKLTPYMVVPRSSMAKTPLRISNSIGIIDKGYRGELLLVVDNLSEEDYTIEKGVRLCQVVPFNEYPTMVGESDSLPDSLRGEAGFGSSGV